MRNAPCGPEFSLGGALVPGSALGTSYLEWDRPSAWRKQRGGDGVCLSMTGTAAAPSIPEYTG